jgi:hypothetical protein
MYINDSIFNVCVPQKRLEYNQIGPTFDVMSGKAVPESMRAYAFRQSCSYCRLTDSIPDGF